MTKINRTRTFLELRVGLSHTVEVILYLRSADMEWYNSNAEEHQTELYGLLSNSIVPRMCGDEIEHYYIRTNPSRYPPEIGEQNHNGKTKKKGGGGRKRKRGGKRNETVVVGQKQDEAAAEDGKKAKKDVYYAFGETLHVAYRTEELDRDQSATLIFSNNNHNNNNNNNNNKKKNDKCRPGSGPFKQLYKLSKRILIWCYPLDPEDPMAPEPEGGGFRRPELVPIAHLFRAPAATEDEQQNK